MLQLPLWRNESGRGGGCGGGVEGLIEGKRWVISESCCGVVEREG